MTTRFTLLFFTLLYTSITYAQTNQNNTATINGIVIAADTEAPLDFATVSLMQKQDSSLIDGNVTDINGEFELTATPGVYYLKVDFLAYQTTYVNDVVINKNQKLLDLGTIRLRSEATDLREVVVAAERSQMEMSLDKKVFNVGKDLSTRGGNAADLLDNVPSVQVDIEGNVSLRGNENARILINGKPSGLVSNGSTGLRQLQANMIEKIEVITNPSARYEAEGTVGIINIILKKEQKTGLNGSFDVTFGYPENYGAAANINYRTPKLNFFGNYGISYRQRPSGGTRYQEIYRNDSTFITNLTRDRKRGGLSNNLRLGADYYFNEKNILTSTFNLSLDDDNNVGQNRYEDYLFTLENPVGVTVRTDDEQEDELNLEYALTYERLFDDDERSFTVDLRYQDNLEKEGSDLRNEYFNGDLTPGNEPDLLQRSNNEEGERQLIFQADYRQPIGEEGKFEAGLRSSLREITNDYAVEEMIGGEWQNLGGFSNVFVYDEKIHAAYLIYGQKFGKFSFQLGVRPEYSQVSTQLRTTNEVNDRDYLNIFPSGHFSYELPKDNSVQISYSRRVRRPRFWSLNPFFTFTDNRNYRSGNPNLDPEFTDAYELGYLKYWDFGSLSSSIYYRHTTGEIERITRVDSETGISTSRPENLLTEDSYGFEINASIDPFKWWRINGDFNFYRAITDGGNLGESFRSDTYSWFTRTTSRFTVWDDLDIQLRVGYRSPRRTTQGIRQGMYRVDLAASKDLLNDDATITVSVRDLFNSRRYRYIAEGENFYTENDYQWRARQVVLTFNYRINQQKRREEGRGGFSGGDSF